MLQVGIVWPSLHQDVVFWCKSCSASQRIGPKKLTYGSQQPIISYGPIAKWGIDAIVPLPRTAGGNEYIIMGVDYMIRWAKDAPVKRVKAKDVEKFIIDIICCKFGTPLEIILDRGPGFRGELVGELMKRLMIKQ